MLKIKFFLLIELFFQICFTIDIEPIKYKNKFELQNSIIQSKTYEIIFNSPKDIPDNIYISLKSLNNIHQIISFSSKNNICQNGQKFKVSNGNMYLEKSQLSINQNYICIRCETPFKECEFKIRFSQGISGLKMYEKNSFLSFIQLENNNDDDEIILTSSQDISLNIYTLSSTYSSKLQIPSNLLQWYQIETGSTGKYKITSGNSVTVDSNGRIFPRNTTWYWYGGIGSTSRDPNREPTRIEVSFTLGTTEINANVGDNNFKVTVNVKDYATEYAESKLNEYIKKNVTNKVTQLEKLNAIAYYPQQFPYNGHYSGYVSMVIFEGGDCWASSSTIQYMCEKVGIKSHIRFAANDGGSGSGHRNVAALIDGVVYIAEAGYGIQKPNRGYSIYKKNIGYSYTSKSNGISIYQYDGYDQDIINVPSEIDGKTVIGLEKQVFYNGPGKTAKKITIPETVTFLGNSVFNSLKNIKKINLPKNIKTIGLYVFAGSDNIEEIEVDVSNQDLISDNGILYNKQKTNIINYPPGKTDEKYEGPSTLERFENYSFYYTKKVKTVVIPKNVKYIGEGAFGNSNIKEIYFLGEAPILEQHVFHDLNLSIYCEKSDSKWESYKKENNFGAKEIRWNNCEGTSYAALIWCIVIFSILIIGGVVAYLFIKKRGGLSSFNLESNFKLFSKE